MTGGQIFNNGENGIEVSFDEAIARHKADYEVARQELGEMTKTIKDKLQTRLAEIKRRAEEDPDSSLSDKMREIIRDDSERGQDTRQRSRLAWKSFLDFNDRLGGIRDAGVSEVLGMFEDDAFLSNTRLVKTVLDDLITREDMTNVGIPETVTTVRAEAQLTSMVIGLLGMDEMLGANETMKIQIARMVWGREIIVDKMMAQARIEEVSVNPGQIREKINFLVYGMLEQSGMDPKEVRTKVENISAAMTTGRGRSEVIKMTTELKPEAIK